MQMDSLPFVVASSFSQLSYSLASSRTARGSYITLRIERFQESRGGATGTLKYESFENSAILTTMQHYHNAEALLRPNSCLSILNQSPRKNLHVLAFLYLMKAGRVNTTRLSVP